MNKLIEAKAFQIGEYWYICARLPLEEGDAVVLPKNSPKQKQEQEQLKTEQYDNIHLLDTCYNSNSNVKPNNIRWR